MRFRFNNIGPIESADLTLGDLTIIAGRNNTGKTYLTYTIYGFLQEPQAWIDAKDVFLRDAYRPLRSGRPGPNLPSVRDLAKSLAASGETAHELNPDLLSRARDKLFSLLATEFAMRLPSVFSSSRAQFRGAAIAVDFTRPLSASLPAVTLGVGRRDRLSAEYTSGTFRLRFSGAAPPRQVSRLIYQALYLLLRSQLPDPFILSAERLGISLFYRELDFAKSQVVDVLQKMGNKDEDPDLPFFFIDRNTSRYALPVKDNIDYTRGIPEKGKKLGSLAPTKTFHGIRDMMDGEYKATADDIAFKSRTRGADRFEIPLHLASSSVRGLSDLYFFLKYVAREGQLLIVDEPESHLDTHNQIRLARLLSHIVRSGIRVLITTHSDYLLKEINNLIMLGHLAERNGVAAEEFGYDPEDALSASRVKAYVAEDRGLVEAQIDDFGMEIPLFDQAIDKINRTSHALAAELQNSAD